MHARETALELAFYYISNGRDFQFLYKSHLDANRSFYVNNEYDIQC